MVIVSLVIGIIALVIAVICLLGFRISVFGKKKEEKK